MDAAALILTALSAGAAESVKGTTSMVIKDAYAGLKALIQRKFKGKTTAETILTEYEKKPDVWKAPLEEELKETETDQDQDVIEAAQKLMTFIQPQQAAMGKYNVQIIGNVQGYAQGDNQQVTMQWDKSKEKEQ